MKRLALVWLAALSLVLSSGAFRADAAPTPAREAIVLNGRSYIRVAAWARADKLEVRWLQPDRVLQISSKGKSIVLHVDSREARLNGTAVWLCFPAVARNGGVYLSMLDVETTLSPILYPPRYRPGQKIKTICVDPGHGGKDPGNQAGANQEKHATLSLAQELRKQLNDAGFRLVMTRATDTYVDLPDRAVLAARRGADLLVSLHFNSGTIGNRTAQGVETYCMTPSGAPSTNARGEGATINRYPGNRKDDFNTLLAFQVQKSLLRTLAAEDRGVRRARFALLRDATMPAVLVEGGFMSHPSEGRRIHDSLYRRNIARAIKEAIVEFKKTVEQVRP